MDKSFLVSVVITTYNSEKTIKKLLNSVYEQSFHNFEVLIIDDGSSDNTKRIVDTFLSKHINRWRWVSCDHHGVSVSRNIGIDEACGKYIVFLDSDDFIENNYLNKLVKMINTSELAVCNYNVKNDNGEFLNYGYVEKSLLSKEDGLKSIIINNEIKSVLWNKMFRLNIIKENNLFFDSDLCIGEDFVFLVYYFKYVMTVRTTEQRLYNYVIQPNSVIQEAASINRSKVDFTEWNAVNKVKQNIELLSSNYEAELNYREFKVANNLQKKILQSKKVKMQKQGTVYLKEISDFFKKSFFKLIVNKYMTNVDKILLFIDTFFPQVHALKK